MAKKPLDRLKHGLSVLRRQIKTRKDELLARLKLSPHLPEEDEDWLDNHANDVDEVQVIDALDNASDYDRGLARLDEKQKGIVTRLLALAGDVVTKPSVKRKRPAERAPTKPKGPKEPTFTRKETSTLEQRVEILDWHHANGGNQTKTAKHWDAVYPNLQLKQPRISKWLKQEAVFREQLNGIKDRGGSTTVKRARQTEHPEVDEMLELWVSKAMSDGVHVTGEVLRQKWTRFADLCGVPADERLKLSDGWLTRFKTRVGLKGIKRHGEAASADLNVVEQDRERIRELIRKHGFRLKDIFNMDETGLFYGMPPDTGLATHQMSGVKGKKTRLTYAFTTNADGTEKREPLIIGRWQKPRCFAGKTGKALGFNYRNNAKSWMTGVLFREWIQGWDSELRKAKRKILLLVDGFSAHLDLNDELTNIHLEFFAPNITSHIQPADAGIIRCFKAHYRRQFIERAIDRYDSGVDPLKIYDINQLEAMRMAETAWREIDTTTIRNCWRKVGILPDSAFTCSSSAAAPAIPVASLLNSDPVADAERDVAQALDALQNAGALHPRRRIALNELLNPLPERQLVEETTEEEIYEDVVARRAAEQDMEANGGDDGPAEDDDDPLPTRKQALAAALLLQQFAAGTPDASARRLETALTSFTQHLRADAAKDLRNTTITDYFNPIRVE